MTVVAQLSTNIHDLGTLPDPTIRNFIKKKLKNNDISLTVSPQIYTASITCKGDDIIILSPKIDAAIHKAAKYFDETPPINETEALFAPIQSPPSIIALKDVKEDKHLDLITTRDLCKSLGWSFFEPSIVKSSEDFIMMVFQCMDASNMKIAVWIDDSVHKLYAYDIGILLGLFVSEEYQKIIQEVGKPGVWYWLLKQAWIDAFSKETSSLETFIDRIYGVFK